MTRTSTSRLLGFASVLALLPALSFTGGNGGAIAADTAARDDAASCRALAGKSMGAGVTITTADYNANGATLDRTNVTVPFCRIVGVEAPSSDSHIGFEVWMPPSSTWNGKYQQVGSGGSAGNIGTGALAVALQAGYATLATDNGHVTDPTAPNGGSENLWAIGHPEKMVDFAWRAVHLSSVAAKTIIADFYGKKPVESYFVGCSTGGRQALVEASRFPDDFDGIVAGAPAWHWTNQMTNAIWNSQTALKDQTAITKESAAILYGAVMKACDKLDGVEDGVISDPRRCDFDPKTIACKDGQTSQCLTPVQVEAAERIYSGSHRSDGTRIFQGYPHGTEIRWPGMWNGDYPGGSAWDFWRYSVSQDRNATSRDFDFDKDTDKMLNGKLLGKSFSQQYNAIPDLSAFEKRGGKLIQFHGFADQFISPYASIDFYNQAVAKIGKEKADEFYRLFLLPGIGHCSGGPGVGNIGGSTPALQHDPEHDIVAALDVWVTQKKAPAVLIGTHLNETSKKPDRTRPLCPVPQEATYTGAGDINDAANFVCKDPGKLPAAPM